MVGAVAGAKAVEGLSQNKATPYIIGGIILVGIGITYFGVIRPILCKTGIADCKSSKKIRDIMSYKGFDPNYARQGLGKALMQQLIHLATQQHMHVMVAAIDSENMGSIVLHQQLGFIQTGYMPQVGQKFGKWRDLVLMQLQLSRS